MESFKKTVKPITELDAQHQERGGFRKNPISDAQAT
jgi:hypothetical protein